MVTVFLANHQGLKKSDAWSPKEHFFIIIRKSVGPFGKSMLFFLLPWKSRCRMDQQKEFMSVHLEIVIGPVVTGEKFL